MELTSIQQARLGTLKALLQDFLYEINTAQLEVTETTKFTDMGMDSLDHLEFVMCVEDHFNIMLEDEEADNITCLLDLVKHPKLS